MIKKSILLVLFILLNRSCFAEDNNTIVLENDAVKAVFDTRNGALTGLMNKKTGWSIQNRPELGLSFNLMVPVPRRRNNIVYGSRQKLNSYRLLKEEHAIVFLWTSVKSEHGGTMSMSLEGKVQLTESGISFDMNIRNKSPYTIEAVAYPVIGDVANPGAGSDAKFECMNVGYDGLNKSSLMPFFPNRRGYFGDYYPTMNFTIPQLFMLIGSGEQGMYLGCHDTSFKEMISWTFELKPGWGLSYMSGVGGTGTVPDATETNGQPVRIECNVWHFPYIRPGETFQLSKIVLAPYKGNWQKGADIYKAWRKTWFRAPAIPQWASKVHSWQQLQVNSPEDEPMIKYRDIVQYGRECAQHKIDAIQLVGWNIGGQDCNHPAHDTDPRLGTTEELKKAIREVEAMGVHINLFNKYTWSDQTTDWFQKELYRYAVKDPYGLYHVSSGDQYFSPVQLNDINTHRLIPMCHLSEKWRAIASKEFQKVVDLGASGMLYDENQHHGGTYYCFDKTHGHRVPALVFAGDVPLVKQFYQISKKVNPDYMYTGEANYDIENQYYQMAYFRFDPTNHIPVKRYIDPNGLIMVAVTGFNDRLTLNGCLRYNYVISYEPYNFKGHVTDFPLTLEYGKKIDELRKQYKSFLWDGIFMDTLHATVKAGDQPYSSYSVFRKSNEHKWGMVIVNNDLKKEITVTARFEKTGPASLASVSPEDLTPQPSNGSVTIPARSAVFVYEK